jgi:hypothetical protein
MVVGRSAAGWLLGLALVACTSEPAQRAAPEPMEPIHVDASGQRYVVRTIDKAQATPFGAGKVRTRNGIDLELAGEDAASWHYKVYLPQERAPKPRAPAPAPPDPPRAADLAASDALQFEPIGAGLPRAGQWREGFDLADLDGDGNLDLVHGPARKGRRVPHVFRGDGRGAFAEWSEARFPSLAYDYGDVRAADFDGDGRLDLALAVHLSGLQLLLGDGRGGFRAAGAGLDWSGAGAGFSSRAIRAADLDGDGCVDLAALGEGPRLGRGTAAGDARPVLAGAQGVVVYRGLGDGAFAPRAPEASGSAIYGTSLVLADFDGDGRLDFATGSSQLGRRDLVQLTREGGAREPLAIATVRPRAYVRAVAAADFDRDGRADLALAYVSIASGTWWSGIDVLFSGESPEWRRLALAAREGRQDFRALAAGDLDADGATDLAALDSAGVLAVFRGDGRGNFTVEREPPPPYPGNCRGSHLGLADVDHDGLADLFASYGQEPPAGDRETCPSFGGLAAWRSVRHSPAR